MQSQAQQDKIHATLAKIIELFRIGDIPEAISIAIFPPYANIPSNRWSLLNRLIMVRSDSSDSRGFKQWSDAGRYPKKGSKAFHIFGPRMIKMSRHDDPEEDEYVVTGFFPIPVFRATDTEGADLQYEPRELSKLPLLEKAREWSIDVGSITFQGKAYGFYNPRQQKIRLASPSELVFFHELAHAAHAKVVDLQECPKYRKEIVAELSAQVLAHLVGTQMENSLGNSYQYIEHYSPVKAGKKDVARACLRVISEVEQVLTLILS